MDEIKKRNEDLAIVWNGQVWDMLVWLIPKGAVNHKEAIDFIVFASDPKCMAVQVFELTIKWGNGMILPPMRQFQGGMDFGSQDERHRLVSSSKKWPDAQTIA